MPLDIPPGHTEEQARRMQPPAAHAVVEDFPDASGISEDHLPTAPEARKGIPLCTGVLDYFPLALAAVAECSQDGNDQHNPGEPLHWAREKSNDHENCLLRHLVDRGKFDNRGIRHSARMAWRALAILQLECEAGK